MQLTIELEGVPLKATLLLRKSTYGCCITGCEG